MSVIKCLAMETSCDETAVAIVNSNKEIVINELFSQNHSKFGGVVPEFAARQHTEILNNMVQELDIDFSSIDCLAVTSGPGLIGGLLVGVMFAKGLASTLKKPLYAINHLEGHALTTRLTDNTPLPFLLLLLSGGHSQIIIAKNVSSYIQLGISLDDSIGETFDKVANMLGLGYPGGPHIEKCALQGDKDRFTFPIPLANSKCCNFSFSGLKTAVRLKILELPSPSKQDIADISASFQWTIVKIIKLKLQYAIHQFLTQFPHAKHIVVSGGVAANQYIKKHIEEIAFQHGLILHTPPISLCTDNAVMIAWAAIERIKNNVAPTKLDFSPRSSWPLHSLKLLD